MTRSAPFDLQIACCGVSLVLGTAAGTPQARAARPALAPHTPAPTHPLLLRGSSLAQLPAPLDLHPYRDRDRGPNPNPSPSPNPNPKPEPEPEP